MDPISTVSSAWESVKVATGIGKALMDLKVEGEIRAKVIAMNNALLDAQQRMFDAHLSHAEMLERMRKLESDLAKYQDWEQERKRYQLHQTEAGGLVYRIKPEAQGSEPVHDICAKCYEDGIKSLMQSAPDANWHLMVACHRCNSQVKVKRYQIPTPSPRRITRSMRLDPL